MYIKEKQYTEEFTKQCRAEFGLEPAQIRKIVATLSVNNALDIDTLLQNAEQLKIALHESNVLINHITNTSIRRAEGFK